MFSRHFRFWFFFCQTWEIFSFYRFKYSLLKFFWFFFYFARKKTHCSGHRNVKQKCCCLLFYSQRVTVTHHGKFRNILNFNTYSTVYEESFGFDIKEALMIKKKQFFFLLFLLLVERMLSDVNKLIWWFLKCKI